MDSRRSSTSSRYSNDGADVSPSRESSISLNDSHADEVATSFEKMEGNEVVVSFMKSVSRLQHYVRDLEGIRDASNDASNQLAAAQEDIKQLKADGRIKDREIKKLKSAAKEYNSLSVQMKAVRDAIG